MIRFSFKEENTILIELSDSFVIDMRNFRPLGPIFHFGVYQIPPQPKKIKHWVITEKEREPRMSPFAYPANEVQLAQLSWHEYWSRRQHDSEVAESTIDELGDTIKSKKSDLNLTAKSTDFLESTIGADETIASDSNNKQFLKSILTKNNEELVKAMKSEGPLQITYK